MTNGDGTIEHSDALSLFGLPGVTDETPPFEALHLTLDLSSLEWADLLALGTLANNPDDMARVDRILDCVVGGGAAAVLPLYRPRVCAAIVERALEMASPKAKPPAQPTPASEGTRALDSPLRRSH